MQKLVDELQGRIDRVQDGSVVRLEREEEDGGDVGGDNH